MSSRNRRNHTGTKDPYDDSPDVSPRHRDGTRTSFDRGRGLETTGGRRPRAQFGLLNRAPVQFAAVEWELVLGVWLISGINPVGAWMAAVATFLTFAGVSFYLGWIGHASCGCFGAIKSSESLGCLEIDLAALGLLAVGRPRFDSFSSQAESARRASWREIGDGRRGHCCCAAALGVAAPLSGPLTRPWRLREPIDPTSPRGPRAGTDPASFETDVEVVNRTDKPRATLRRHDGLLVHVDRRIAVDARARRGSLDSATDHLSAGGRGIRPPGDSSDRL